MPTQYHRSSIRRILDTDSADYIRALAALSAGLDGSEADRKKAQLRNIDLIHRLRDQLGFMEGIELFSGSCVAYSHFAAFFDLEQTIVEMAADRPGDLKRITSSYLAFMERLGRFIASGS